MVVAVICESIKFPHDIVRAVVEADTLGRAAIKAVFEFGVVLWIPVVVTSMFICQVLSSPVHKQHQLVRMCVTGISSPKWGWL